MDASSSSVRITASNPARPLSPNSMDYERCAALHNELLARAVRGIGREMPPNPRTWWEVHSPGEEIVDLLEPPLIEFLKRAHDEVGPLHDDKEHFMLSYFLAGLMPPEDLLEGAAFTYDDSGRFIKLYGSSNFRLGDDEGLLFNQHTMTATFIEDYNDTPEVARHEWGWMPLEVILDSYLQMIDEGKMEAVPNWKAEELGLSNYSIAPWVIHQYTKTDITRTVSAFQRLVNAIELKIEDSTSSMSLPWHDPVTLSQDFIPNLSFAHDFLSAISHWKVRFRYIAPGIRFPTITEFLDQPITEFNNPSPLGFGHFPGFCPLRIFQTDVEGPARDHRFYACYDKPAGVYIQPVVQRWPSFWSNGCRLLLPYGIGSNGWARQSNGQPFGIDNADERPKPQDESWSLYQAGFTNGFTNHHFVQLDKVLNNWAERVENGDWEVGQDGVAGGIEKFKEADTEEHWHKYWMPPGW
ncbi:hypothetical protein BDV18DRAFT_167636 [Aspergillus unguis]